MGKVVDHTLYLHSDKESNYDAFGRLGGDPDSEGAQYFSYAGYEVGIQCMVNLETGECMAYGIQKGNKLVEFSEPVEIN